ncbi:hypothetical protein BDZ89DRAFT_1090789 [Hymenopellis radicata]|nr:hypothetical protein BDZ89DRAFT_1090789 [Hymenopellis radicata]
MSGPNGADRKSLKSKKEILENLAKFPHCLLLTRVGQFYESYFEQATEIARILNIKETTRKWDQRRIPMCGFPIMHLDKYLKIMVEQEKKFVAMCEEFPQYHQPGVKSFERRVVRVITPGTLIDESFLNQYENNYLLSVGLLGDATDMSNASRSQPVGLAWIDVSTGEFYSKSTTFEGVRDDVARIGPREIVLHQSFQQDRTHPLFAALSEDKHCISFIAPDESPSAQPYQQDPDPDGALLPNPVDASLELDAGEVTAGPRELVTDEIMTAAENVPSVYTPEETLSIDLLTSFLKAHLLEHMPILSRPNREDTGERMRIDSHTIKALEIRESIREGGTTGSLLSTIKRTVTTSGTRLLTRWLGSPSTSIPEINARLSLVEFFHNRPYFREDLVEFLPELEDASRIVQKFSLGRGDASDLLGIRNTAATWSDLRRRIEQERLLETRERDNFNPEEWSSLDSLLSRMANLDDLHARIDSALSRKESNDTADLEATESEEETPSVDVFSRSWRYTTTKWTIKPQFSETLQSLHGQLARLLKDKEDLENKLQLQYDASSLSLRSSPGIGLHVHIAKSKRDRKRLDDDAAFVPVQSSNSTISYFYGEWARLGAQIFETSTLLVAAEKEAFDTLRNEVNGHAPLLRRNARIVDELDVTLGFANLAAEMNFVKPILRDDLTFRVDHARHPTVELGLMTSGRMFTSNSLELGSTSRMHIITGPNMAGKSTLLRQTALVSLLAQAGCFVPAAYAELGIVDQLFARIGAKDDLFHDRSTFMVEMLETAEILRRATPRSLVIMDEVGRGTTVKDGLALAYATIHHLVTVNQCRALFATHFNELADMLGYTESEASLLSPFDTVSFFCTTVDEATGGRFAYSYRVRPGVNRDSHGLKVALLADMPASALNVAEKTLRILNSKSDQKWNVGEFQNI